MRYENVLSLAPLNSATERRATIRRSDGKSLDLYFKSLSGEPLGDYSNSDPFVVASALFFSGRGGEVKVEGTVSSRLLVGLEEWNRAMGNYYPKLYKPTVFVPDEVSNGPVKVQESGILGFSGGIDATFSLCRHQNGEPGAATVNIEQTLLVHGFDVPLEDRDKFNLAASVIGKNPLLKDSPLQLVETNFRQFPYNNWPRSHASAVAATLGVVATGNKVGLIASSYTYRQPRIGWGSAPELDHLLSSEQLEIRHDGASFSRTEKIEYIAQFPEVIDSLRFCFHKKGIEIGKNCGMCEKCWRTRMGFALAGIDNPSCFPDIPLESIRLPKLSGGHRVYWNDLLADAKARENTKVESLVQQVLAR